MGSLDTANQVAMWASTLFVVSLVVGLLTTCLLIWSSNVKEEHWDKERAELRERNSELTLALETARAETARADAILLKEQRLNARERMRLERLERAVLPRGLSQEDAAALVADLKAGGFPKINIAVLQKH